MRNILLRNIFKYFAEVFKREGEVLQSRCSFLELLILAILINEGELHGYAIHKQIIEATQMQWKPSIGTIYRLLNEMAEKGLIARSAAGRRQVYAVTPQGTRYFADNSINPLTRRVGVIATVLKALLSLAKENPEVLTPQLKERLKALKKILKQYSELLVEN